MEEKKHEIVIDPKSGDVTEQIQKLIAEQNNNRTPMNRKQRRAMEKKNKKQEKKLQKYLERHPEAMKIELDEEAIKKVEEQEKLAQEQEIEIVSTGEERFVSFDTDNETIIDVPFTELAEEEK
jgi:hypothetical protein